MPKSYEEGRIEGYLQALDDLSGVYIPESSKEGLLAEFIRSEYRRDERGSFVPAKDIGKLRELISRENL